MVTGIFPTPSQGHGQECSLHLKIITGQAPSPDPIYKYIDYVGQAPCTGTHPYVWGAMKAPPHTGGDARPVHPRENKKQDFSEVKP
ncbi:hypothetical protein [Flavonifractor phage Castelnaud]|nr:hypothetical protein [Flavonifractor phage Castelnaud]